MGVPDSLLNLVGQFAAPCFVVEVHVDLQPVEVHDCTATRGACRSAVHADASGSTCAGNYGEDDAAYVGAFEWQLLVDRDSQVRGCENRGEGCADILPRRRRTQRRSSVKRYGDG